MIKRVNKDYIYDFAVSYFPSFDLGPFSKCFAYLNDDVCGFISYSVFYERAEIEYIAVSPKYRGNGISDELFSAFLSDLDGVTSVSLEVSVYNTRAINFYLKHGFKKVSVRKNYYDFTDAFLMVLEVG